MIYLLIILAIGGVIAYFVLKNAKKLKVPSVYLITGAVKTGKTAFSVGLAVKKYKSNLMKWYIRLPFIKMINGIIKVMNLMRKHKDPIDSFIIPLKPMLYSNIPLRYVRYNNFTIDILMRQKRIPNKSVVLLDEVSLLADSMLFNDKKVNESLTLFVKLFGHYSHGGSLYINTQSKKDTHFAFKRSIGQFLYIYHLQKGIFFNRYKVREMLSSDDGDGSSPIQNTFDNDIETSMLTIWHRKKYLKYYDCYCYSIFTDDLQYQVDYKNPIKKRNDSLKAKVLVTLQDWKSLQEFKEKEKKQHENTQQN